LFYIALQQYHRIEGQPIKMTLKKGSIKLKGLCKTSQDGRRKCIHIQKPFRLIAYFRDMLRKVSTHPADQIDELLPNNWKPPMSNAKDDIVKDHAVKIA